MNTTSVSSCLSNGTDCDNGTVSLQQCEEPNVSLFPAAIDYLKGIITIAIIAGSLCINILVVYLVIRFKQLRQRAFYLALQLVVLNLVFTVSVLPSVAVSSIARKWILGDVMCQIIGSINEIFFPVHYFIVLVLTLDRFFTVFTPFFYSRYGNKVAAVMSLVLWFLGLCRIVSITAPSCVVYGSVQKVCSSARSCNPACKINNVVLACLLVLFCIVLPIILYVMMYLRGRQLDRKVLTAEENAKRLFNKRVLKTFLLTLGGVGFIGIILYVWQSFSSELTVGAYAVQSLIIGALGYGLTITDSIIILRNKDVRDVWKKLCK